MTQNQQTAEEAVNRATQKQQNVECEVVTVDILQNLAVDTVKQNKQTVQFEVLLDNKQTVEGSGAHNDTEPTDCTV